jgi:hypothetical protein
MRAGTALAMNRSCSALFALVPVVTDVDLLPTAVWRDPPTAAAFDLQRIDVLTAGETLDEIGHVATSVRLVVRNRSTQPARFRAEIALSPDLGRMERAIGNIVEEAWRRGRDARSRGACRPEFATAPSKRL